MPHPHQVAARMLAERLKAQALSSMVGFLVLRYEEENKDNEPSATAAKRTTPTILGMASTVAASLLGRLKANTKRGS
jgi:hypothetical protein